MSPLRSYRHLFGLVGSGYVTAAFVARVPLAMSQIGTLLLVAGSTGSYGAGGAAAGTLAVANAIGAPIAGALADRHGQRPIVLVQSLGGAAGLCGLVAVTLGGASSAVVLALAALAGLALPQVGPLARVRWRPATRGQRGQSGLVATAFSYEGAADEASFVLGPVLVGVIAALIDPAGALLSAAALLAVFGTLFALHRTAPTGARRGAGEPAAPAMLSLALGVAMAAQFLIGSIFGSIQTGTTVLATAAGEPGAAGLLHALLGVGSVVAAVSYAALPDRFTLPARLGVAAAGLCLGAAPLLLADGLGSVATVTLVLGFAVAPLMITTFTLGERIVPPARVGTAMTLLAAVTGLGYATGSALAGHLADRSRDAGPGGLDAHTAAYAVTLTSAALALLVAVAGFATLTRALAKAPSHGEDDEPQPPDQAPNPVPNRVPNVDTPRRTPPDTRAVTGSG